MPENETGELFPTSAPQRGRSLAPEELPPSDVRAIIEWAEAKVPWVSRGAFESFTAVEDYIDETLEWWCAAGRMRKDWRKTVQNRIRKLERGRLESLARRGSEDAKLALRQPAEWARRYDRKQKVAGNVGGSGESDLIKPSGGSVIQFADRRGRQG